MAGRMGNTSHVVEHLLVYKWDYKRNLLFLKGSCSGPEGELLQIYDSRKKMNKMHTKLPFPTFITEKGKTYPNVLEFADSEDLNEKYTNDNDEILGISDEEEEGEPEKTAEDESSPAAVTPGK